MEIESLKNIFNPIKVPKTDISSLDAIEEQLMKLGTLQHDEIDWDLVFTNSLNYLSVKEKNLNMLYAFVMSMQMQGAYESVICAGLYVQFGLLFGKELVEGNERSIRKFKKIAQSIGQKLDQIDPQKMDFQAFSYIEDISSQLTKSKADVSLKKILSGVMQRIDKKILLPEKRAALMADKEKSIDEKPPEKSAEPAPARPVIKEAEQKDPNPVAGPEHEAQDEPCLLKDTDFKTARKIKQTLLEVASFIASIAPADPLSYLLRRFAIWQPVDSLPETVNGATMLKQVPKERVEEYETGIKDPESAETNIDLLMQIEKSITACPFWTYGNYLSASLAQKAGMNSVAKAIKTSLTAFINQHEGIAQLHFSGGEPFIPEVVEAWLASSSENTNDGERHTHGQTNLDPNTLNTICGSLHEISGSLHETNEPRLQILSQLKAIEVMAGNGDLPLAATFLATLDHRIQKMKLKEWEPSIFKKIKYIKKEYRL